MFRGSAEELRLLLGSCDGDDDDEEPEEMRQVNEAFLCFVQ